MIKKITPELISDLGKYLRILEDVKTKGCDLEYRNPISKNRLINLGIELRASIQELNNYLK